MVTFTPPVVLYSWGKYPRQAGRVIEKWLREKSHRFNLRQLN